MKHSNNIEQRRAAAAILKLQQYNADISNKLDSAEQARDSRSEYLSAVKALPAAILQNGLGQTLASYKAANTDGPKHVYQHLGDWLCSEHDCTPFTEQEQLLNALVTHCQNTYVAAQAETLAYARWLKKLAIAEFPPTDNSRDGDGNLATPEPNKTKA